jgi:hypothetical protein
VVAAVVEDTSEHGGTTSGPVVRDIVKAYYDKKNKKTQGQVTAENHPPQLQKNTASPVAPRVVLKPQETAAVVSTNEKRKARPE